MKPSERRQALRDIGKDWQVVSSWNYVRDWIKDMVQIEPKVMRQVAKMEFGDLGNWIEKGKGNIEACGCLIGTTALALVEDRNHFKVNVDSRGFKHTTEEFKKGEGWEAGNEKGDYAGASKVVGLLVKKQLKEDMEDWASEAGCSAKDLREALGQETAVALIKDEITRQLKRRSQVLKRRKLAAAS